METCSHSRVGPLFASFPSCVLAQLRNASAPTRDISNRYSFFLNDGPKQNQYSAPANGDIGDIEDARPEWREDEVENLTGPDTITVPTEEYSITSGAGGARSQTIVILS